MNPDRLRLRANFYFSVAVIALVALVGGVVVGSGFFASASFGERLTMAFGLVTAAVVAHVAVLARHRLLLIHATYTFLYLRSWCDFDAVCCGVQRLVHYYPKVYGSLTVCTENVRDELSYLEQHGFVETTCDGSVPRWRLKEQS